MTRDELLRREQLLLDFLSYFGNPDYLASGVGPMAFTKEQNDEFFDGEPITWRTELEEVRKRLAAMGDDQTESGDLDTGHYDDGHSFGWRPVPTSTPPGVNPPLSPIKDKPIGTPMGPEYEEAVATYLGAAILPDHAVEPPLDTGHYDDGHSFGWPRSGSPPPVSPPPDDLPVADGRSSGPGRTIVVGGIFVVGLIIVVAIGFLLRRDDGTVVQPVVASDSTTAAPASTSAPTTGVTESAAKPDRPITYKSECNGSACNSLNTATCDLTYHFAVSFPAGQGNLDGQIARIETAGWGLDPVYEVPIAGGKIDMMLVAPGAKWGGKPPNCTVAGAHWVARVTSVGGKPTITPTPPP